MSTALYENEIRDLLANNLQLIEPGLILLKKESFIPNSLGTRGFIDLLARDEHNHFVLIELKRSVESSREAIHEVLKYVEGVKSHFGAKDDEIRVAIVSTEWKELLVPFSRLLKDSDLNIQGYQLDVDAEKKLTVSRIKPLTIKNGRFIAPWYLFSYYKDKYSLQRGIAEYEAFCSRNRIENYLLSVFLAPEGHHQKVLEEVRASVGAMHGQVLGDDEDVDMDDIVSRIPELPYLVCFAMQALDIDECLNILKSDPGLHDEVSEIISDYEDEEDKQCTLHQYIFSIPPMPHSDYLDSGYPAKVRKLFMDNWETKELKRFGSFERNTLLSHHDIIEELCGSLGNSGQTYKKTISLSNRAQVALAKDALSSCLKDNPRWNAQVIKHLEEAEVQYPSCEAEISIYNPSAGLTTLFLVATNKLSLLYVPSFHIKISTGTHEIMYYGCLTENGATPNLLGVLDKYYSGSMDHYMMTLSWGGYEQADTDILEDVGLVYSSFRIVVSEKSKDVFAFQDYRWKPVQNFNPFSTLSIFFNKNKSFIEELIEEIRARGVGGFYDGN